MYLIQHIKNPTGLIAVFLLLHQNTALEKWYQRKYIWDLLEPVI